MSILFFFLLCTDSCMLSVLSQKCHLSLTLLKSNSCKKKSETFPAVLGNAMRNHSQYATLEINQIIVIYNF